MLFDKCLRCKRPLRSEESRKRGYGSLCFKLMKKEGKRQSLMEEYENV